MLAQHIELTDDQLAVHGESVKFAEILPRHLLFRTIVARHFEVMGVDL
jgi:hypothetical protein